MDQLSIEKGLTISYLLCAIMGIISSVTTGIAWGHWYLSLDQCGIGRNCSCILYGQNTFSRFLGGGQAPCIWITYGPLLYVFLAICMTCFHGYRVLFTTKSPKMRTKRSVIARMNHGSSVQIETIAQEDISSLYRCFWITMSVLTSIFFVYALVHFAIFLDGFYTTCNEYRKMLEKLLSVHGTILPVIHRRLHCQSVFDFMDYMQLDSENAYRNGYINTGLALILGIIASCFGWIIFFFASCLNITMAKRQN
ncbi:uncharacterized protein LOC115886466 isoform X1 [Sitophilus oryzae]|uniref:Uncharacterized protein LOC115886466 isoform X1 n=1 Tax=Sitophilus oryzae TaxID=7048 RepID=A0A6J2YDP3_SITOR|nr:uncharacterized protein LOC115886466 isoform X1 [Sitophilus oryzae]